MVVRDVRHRWNYTHAMIERVLFIVRTGTSSERARQAIDSWVFDREELRPLALKTEDWNHLEALGGLLKVSVSI
ncbi:hypothetical protein B0H14DRAFT_2356714 [Mycena olivaceomarginata]|nr:hypothetical protein B0H14DRAFT_2356714 [Mycena olivaceomarginata]